MDNIIQKKQQSEDLVDWFDDTFKHDLKGFLVSFSAFRQRKRRVEAKRLRIMSVPVPSVLGTPEHQNGPGLDTSVIPVIPELTSAQSQV